MFVLEPWVVRKRGEAVRDRVFPRFQDPLRHRSFSLSLSALRRGWIRQMDHSFAKNWDFPNPLLVMREVDPSSNRSGVAVARRSLHQ